MSLLFRCPECQDYVRVAASFAGLHSHCPSCGVTVAVPDHDEPPDADTERRLSAKKKWEARAPAIEAETPDPKAILWPWLVFPIAFVSVLGGIIYLMVSLAAPS